MHKAITDTDLLASAVLSGNRNFEGRVNPLVKANFLASPPLVVAYALAGNTNIDLTTEPLGFDQNNEPVYLKDIMPTNDEVAKYVDKFVTVNCLNMSMNMSLLIVKNGIKFQLKKARFITGMKRQLTFKSTIF